MSAPARQSRFEGGAAGQRVSMTEIVAITGASGGVGRATAHAFARDGAAVALLARGKRGLDAAAREVEQLGGHPLVVPVDVADADAVEHAAATIEGQLGPMDVWVNDAMATIFARFLDITADEYERSTSVTYLGYVNGTRAALRRMKERNRGTIVQVGSALAYRGIPLQTPYCGAKHAIQGFTEALRCELMHDGIDVHLTMVQMPALNTPQFSWGRTRLPNHPQPVPPIYQPEVAAEAIFYAAHHRRREIYVGGSTAVTIMGNKVAAGMGDRYLAKKGLSGQQTDQPVNGDRPDNLFEPADADRDFGTHGIFDDRSKPQSFQLRADLRRGSLAVAGGALAAGALLLRRR
jgi:NAD(P)-dependent dehydrogenase (short-subunit alcohol dehydrogenase family)